MKQKIKRLVSTFLALAMVISMIPSTTFTVFAAEPIVIEEIKSKISAELVPKAGMEVRDFMPTVPDGEPYERPWNGAEWYDSSGVKIAASVNHHYDLGYEFEAGHTYYADYKYIAYDGYVFSDNPAITLTGPDPSMFTYEIIDRWDNDESVTVRFTFTIPGDFEYRDISKVAMEYYGPVAEGRKVPDWCKMIYNNCTITREEWNTGEWGSTAEWGIYTGDNSGAKTFLEGETYVHMIELTANDGYKFSPGLHVQKGTQDAEEYGVIELSDDRTVATVKYTYDVASYTIIDTVELVAANQFVDFCLRSGESIYLPQPFHAKYALSADCPYEADSQGSCYWYNDETGARLSTGYPQTFEAGKTYTLKFEVEIKDEFETTHKFSDNPTLSLSNYNYKNADFVKFDISGGGQYVTVEVTFTAQFPENAGKYAHNPVICHNFREFKYAMENPDIRYVAIGNVNEVLPSIAGDGLIPAITVTSDCIKNLQLLGDATFTAPANYDGYKTICALMMVHGTLKISGAGSLTFKAVANNSYNAVVLNQGGSVSVSDSTLIGSYNTAVYGKAIWQIYGDLNISSGQFFAENALAPLSLPRSHDAVFIEGGTAYIEGGTFRTRNFIDTIDKTYGLDIGQNATVDLSGGTFYGIHLPTSTTYLSDYMDEDLYTPLSDEHWFNPESEHSQQYTESEKIVRIAWLIDHVDVHVNAPVAGQNIETNYFNIPTSGCQATMYYPQWYKNGEIVTYGQFEAGANYKVVVQIETKPGYNAEFTRDVEVAINNRLVDVDYNSKNWIEVEYDFGECPDTIGQVGLYVDAPKEGNTVKYSISDDSSAYQAMGSGNNITDYRQWYVSDNGNDNWTLMSSTDKFVAGKYYKFVTWVQAASRYEFLIYDNGYSIVPDVYATVNGYTATVRKAYEQDPSKVIVVEYNFGICNDSIIEAITIVDVEAPVAGHYPNYSYSILGSGYVKTDKNEYYDDWMHDRQLYYIRNGIGWFDMTEFDWVYENEIFLPGHEYQVNLYIETEDGYTFWHNKDLDMLFTATVNGQTAYGNTDSSEGNYYQRIESNFICAENEISTITVNNLEEPQIGKTPDTTVSVNEGCEVQSVRWLDVEDDEVSVFEEGQYYTVEIVVGSVKYDGTDICTFADNVTAYVNNNEVTGWNNTVTTNNNNTVTIVYEFRQPPSSPEIVYYTVSFDANGGSGTMEAANYVSGLYLLPQCTFTAPDGYSFKAWSVNGVEKAPGNLINVLEDTTITAVWQENQLFMVAYNGNGGEGTMVGDMLEENDIFTLEECTYYAPEGYRFKAWAIGSVDGPQKQPGEQITITGETYIYAIWELIPQLTDCIVITAVYENGEIEVVTAEDGTPIVVVPNSLVKNATMAITLNAVEYDSNGDAVTTNVKWSSDNTSVAKVAAVKGTTDSATATIGKNVDGLAVITATSNDSRKMTSTIEIDVRDFTPRLETNSVTLNTYKTEGAGIKLYTAYDAVLQDYPTDIALMLLQGDEVLDVMLEGKGSENFTAVYDTENSTVVFNTQDVVKDGTYKLTLNIFTAKGYTSQAVTVKVANKLPKVTIKQGTTFELFFKDRTADITVTATDPANTKLDAPITAVAMTDCDTFTATDYDAQTDSITVSYLDQDNPLSKYVNGKTADTKVNLVVSFDGYRESYTQKNYTIKAKENKITLTQSRTSTKYTTVGNNNTPVDVINSKTKEVIDLTGCAVTVQGGSAGYVTAVKQGAGLVINPILNGNGKFEVNGKQTTSHSAKIDIQGENWLRPITISHSISINTTALTVKLKESTLKLNSAFDTVVQTQLVPNLDNCPELYWTITPQVTSKQPAEQFAKLNVSQNGWTVTARFCDENDVPAKGDYKYLLTATAGGKNISLTLKVSVSETLPSVPLAKTSVKLNKEVKEEAGLDVRAERIIAVQDRKKHNPEIYANNITKVFILCRLLGGS
ncbi:MAG: InlB B-repeat-containing protein, partial [Oscillospiraceae bacterium]|nr:InlB B-repeat-containing protein [Oscillospiraceae bacterium]